MGTMKKAIALLLACMLMIGIFAGCSSQNAGDSEKTNQQTQPAATTATEAVSGNENTATSGPVELTLGSAMAWETLAPFRTMRVWAIIYSRMIYDSLAWKTADGVLNPVAAKSIEVEDDGVTWNVEIYDYITDAAGNHITIDDVIWFMEESQKQAMKPFFLNIVSIEKTGDYSMKVVMKEDMHGAFDYVLTNTFIVSRAAYEADPDGFVSNVVATGPYQVTEFVSGSKIVLEKKSDYWQKEELIPESMKNNVDKLTMLYISEASQQQIALETGEVDAFQAISQSLISSFPEDKFTVASVPSIAGTCLRFSGSANKNIANDINLRKAIAYAIDVDGLIQGVYGGYGKVMTGPESSGTDGYQESWGDADYYGYNVELAKEYLAKSNYNGETLELLASSSAANERIGVMLQAYLAEIGVTLKLNIVDRALYTASCYDGDAFDLEIMSSGSLDQASMWQSNYDIHAYPNGDASGRKDEVLYEMISKAWTNAGYTTESINEVHDYLVENLYDYGMVQPYQCDVYANTLGITKVAPQIGGGVDYIACEYGK